MEKDAVWVDWYPLRDAYIVFVCGHSINQKESTPNVANRIAKKFGQKTYQRTIYGDGIPIKQKIEVY